MDLSFMGTFLEVMSKCEQGLKFTLNCNHLNRKINWYSGQCWPICLGQEKSMPLLRRQKTMVREIVPNFSLCSKGDTDLQDSSLQE